MLRSSPHAGAGPGNDHRFERRSAKEDIIENNRGRPIFIIGCARSGTTLLGLMLQAHPRIAIPPENRFLVPAYLDRQEFGDLSEPDNRRALAEHITSKKRWYRDVGLKPQAIVDKIVDEGVTVGAALGIVLRAYADRFEKVRWGDKRPGYHNYIWAIQRLFPDAQFIHLVRDGRDAVASMKRSLPNEYGTTYRRANAWMEAIEHAAEAQRALRPDTFYELQYEHLVSAPEKQLTALCEFLGEPFDDAMLSPQEVSAQVVPERKQHHARTREEVSGTSVGNFHSGLEPWEVELCEAVMGERLQAYGYELSGVDQPAQEQLEEYRLVAAKRERQLEQERAEDRAILDVQPVADATAVAGKQERIAELESQVATLDEQVSKIASERNAQQERLDRVLASRAWRLTKPLRAAKRLVSHRRS